jgi:hypothetical protein
VFANPHGVLSRRWNHFFELLNVSGVCDVRPTEIHTAEPLVPEPGDWFWDWCRKAKRHKSPGIDQIHTELIKRGRKFALICIKLLILFGIRRNCLLSGRIRSLYLFIRRVMKQIVSRYSGMPLLAALCRIWSNILLSRFTAYSEEIFGDHQCGFGRNKSATDHKIWIFEVL